MREISRTFPNVAIEFNVDNLILSFSHPYLQPLVHNMTALASTATPATNGLGYSNAPVASGSKSTTAKGDVLDIRIEFG
jgi:hypothetical protein